MIPSDYGSHAAHVCSNKECLATAALRVVSFPDVIEHDLYISEEGTELSGRSLKLEAKSGKVSM